MFYCLVTHTLLLVLYSHRVGLTSSHIHTSVSSHNNSVPRMSTSLDCRRIVAATKITNSSSKKMKGETVTDPVKASLCVYTDLVRTQYPKR